MKLWRNEKCFLENRVDFQVSFTCIEASAGLTGIRSLTKSHIFYRLFFSIAPAVATIPGKSAACRMYPQDFKCADSFSSLTSAKESMDLKPELTLFREKF